MVVCISGTVIAADLCGNTIEFKLSGQDSREGVYAGEWRLRRNTSLCSGVIIEGIAAGQVTFVYFYGMSPELGVRERQSFRQTTNIEGNSFGFKTPKGSDIYFTIDSQGEVRAENKGSTTPPTVFRKV